MKVKLAIVTLLLVLVCSAANAGPLERRVAAKAKTGAPVVALVLSGGGAKGTAEIGALKFLDSLGFDFDIVVGTSMGSIVGGLYALGYTPAEIDSLAREQDWSQLMSDRVPRKFNSFLENIYRDKYLFSVTFDLDGRLDSVVRAAAGAEDAVPSEVFFKTLPSGFINGHNIMNLFTGLSVGYQDSTDFSSFPIPFACIATDLVTGNEIVMRSGRFPQAIRSSMAIPGVFSPVRVGDMILIDGGTKNNYPVDIAREMGADIVIGVDVSGQKAEYADINNIGDVAWQFISIMGDEKYQRNVKDVDIHIRPDLTGYGMMSFDSASIDTLIGRGYRAAKAKEDELRAMLERIRIESGYSLGYVSKQKYNAPKAVNVYSDSIMLKSVAIIGVNKAERMWIKKNIEIPLYTLISSTDIDNMLSGIYSTGSFKSVTYELVGRESPYEMRIFCEKGNPHQLGIGAKFDTEEIASVIMNAGFNSGKLTGSRYDLTARLSMNPYFKFDYSYVMPKAPKLNFSLLGGYTDTDIFSSASDGRSRAGLNFYRFNASAYISNISIKWIDLNLGVMVDGFYFKSFLTSSDIVGDYDLTQTLNSYVSAYGSATIDTRDDAYFPTQGFAANLEYSYYFTGFYESFNPFHHIGVDAMMAIPVSKMITVIPSLNGRFLIGNDVPLPYINVMGGLMAGRYIPQQLPFVGTTNLNVLRNNLVMARCDIRANVTGKHYVSVMANYVRDCDSLKDFFVGNGFVGVGAEYSYRSMIGPLSVSVFWSNYSRRLGAYVSIGYYF